MILIFAKTDDKHALEVTRILGSNHSEKAFIFDTSAFPTSVLLSGIFGDRAFNLLLTDVHGHTVDLTSITSFWWRRPQGVAIDANIINPEVYNFTLNECISALYGMSSCCDGLWVNDIHNDDAADYKPRQLHIANNVGFCVPETLITNDPDRVVEFWHRHQRRVIYKSFNQRGVIWRPTRLLKTEDLTLIQNVRYAPVIFQPFIPGNRDIRVTVIGENIFATEFINQGEEIDYRVNLSTIPCLPHSLPKEIIDRIHVYMCTLGLEYGGIDFRLTPNNEYVFLEINTAGEFLYLQERTGQPIAEALASHLMKGQRINVSKSA
jgi:hypothetical protein